MTGGGDIKAFGFLTTKQPNVSVEGTLAIKAANQAGKITEGYEFFVKRFGVMPERLEHHLPNPLDAPKPASLPNSYYYTPNDLTISESWNVTSGEMIVIFVEHNLYLEDIFNVGNLINVEKGGLLLFVVRGDILIDESVGNSDPTLTTPNLAGLYVADGWIRVNSDEDANTQDKRFIGEGSFIGHSGVDLNRSFAPNSAVNLTTPAETFRFRPDFMNTIHTSPDTKRLKPKRRLWQEAN